MFFIISQTKLHYYQRIWTGFPDEENEKEAIESPTKSTITRDEDDWDNDTYATNFVDGHLTCENYGGNGIAYHRCPPAYIFWSPSHTWIGVKGLGLMPSLTTNRQTSALALGKFRFGQSARPTSERQTSSSSTIPSIRRKGGRPSFSANPIMAFHRLLRYATVG